MRPDRFPTTWDIYNIRIHSTFRAPFKKQKKTKKLRSVHNVYPRLFLRLENDLKCSQKKKKKEEMERSRVVPIKSRAN
ncbi:hypothetical protein OUZ56_009362 [Daphnia magna]|uniref:Uncharacterized protein n=1 Tax=Daphnia magna TaxID=35525 RepID=A0ABR0AFR8_9CRUS|nr:hypothetical protein OUZ56_009362 [Daphnia magna]